jgi:hypothetical protein
MRRVMEVLKRVHVDVIHIMPRNLNGKNYVTLFINEATFTKWGYTFVIKSKAFDLIKQFD